MITENPGRRRGQGVDQPVEPLGAAHGPGPRRCGDSASAVRRAASARPGPIGEGARALGRPPVIEHPRDMADARRIEPGGQAQEQVVILAPFEARAQAAEGPEGIGPHRGEWLM